MKTDLFQSCGHCWVFQICWHIECSPFTASSFRLCNSSAGIPSSLLALFIVMPPKTHLTSDSRMSGSRWVITPPWLSGSLRHFCIVLLCMLAPHVLSSASVRTQHSVLSEQKINPTKKRKSIEHGEPLLLTDLKLATLQWHTACLQIFQWLRKSHYQAHVQQSQGNTISHSREVANI